jgi:hypothetical protein
MQQLVCSASYTQTVATRVALDLLLIPTAFLSLQLMQGCQMTYFICQRYTQRGGILIRRVRNVFVKTPGKNEFFILMLIDLH